MDENKDKEPINDQKPSEVKRIKLLHKTLRGKIKIRKKRKIMFTTNINIGEVKKGMMVN